MKISVIRVQLSVLDLRFILVLLYICIYGKDGAQSKRLGKRKMDEKNTNNSAKDFGELVFDLSPETANEVKEIEGEGFTMTPSEVEPAKAEEGGFVMKPSESESKVIAGEAFTMKPSEAESKESAGEGFTMKPSEQEEKVSSPAADVRPSVKEDKSESLEEDFGKMDEAPIKDAMAQRDQALRDSVEAASGGTPKSTLTWASAAKSEESVKPPAPKPAPAADIKKPEINASTTVVDGDAPAARPVSRSNTSNESAAGRVAGSTTYSRTSGSAPTGAPAGSGTYKGGSHYASKPSKPEKEKKYVTRGTLIGCMILTMLLSTFLGSLLGGGLKAVNNLNNFDEDNRKEREDSKLSELNLSEGNGGELTVTQIVDKNEDAVVEIVVSGTTQGMWGQMQLVEGAGSGVIIRDDGYIATNYHVIQGANKVQVTLRNGQVYPATIVGSDPSNDVAVIKIDETELKTAEIGDSSTVDVGDLAVAIGNPLGQLGGSVTTGIISALDRTLTVEGTTLTLLQTDAAINGGNSGGGLFNARGELIGIVESKASAVGVEGLGFALPINSVAEILNDIIASGGDVSGQSASTPAVGIAISDVSEEQSQYYGLDEPGVYVAQVTGENAQKAGFREQDRIVSFNGTKITNSSEFIALVRKCKVGDVVSIIVSRDGQEIEIKTELEELQLQQ